MKTFQEVKDEFAGQKGWDSWEEWVSYHKLIHSSIDVMEDALNVVSRRYAIEVGFNALQNAADNVRIKAEGQLYISPYKYLTFKGKQTYEKCVSVDKSTIKNPKNVQL